MRNDLGPEVWRGGVNTWECDEMGHLNVRFYVARAMEGLAGLARLMGLPHAFAPHGDATLVVREHHVRFLREARPGTALYMTGGVVELGETDAVLQFLLNHTGDGAPCAAIRTRVEHVTPHEGRVFPWPSRARAAAQALRLEPPEHARPRSIDAGPVVSRASLARADALGLTCTGRGALSPRECDVFGRMRPDEFLGRVSDGVPGLLAGVRRTMAESAPGEARRVGGAVLEYRLIYLELPRIGDHLELRTGISGYEGKTQRLNHWLLDPLTGRAWATSEAVAVNFDLDTRKAVPISAEAGAVLDRFLSPELGF